MPAEGLKSAADATKQIMTLSTGITALTVTFAKEFKTGNALTVPWQLKWAWIIYGVTLFFALWTMLAITGTLANVDAGTAGGPRDTNILIPSVPMVLSFILAFGLTICAGFTIIK
jgi:hypothetical protein